MEENFTARDYTSQAGEDKSIAVMEVSRPGLVSRPDFMGLGLISVSSLKGLGLARDLDHKT